jgi:uncharacterized SAM-binding protein YcdF (DUF218 family)
MDYVTRETMPRWRFVMLKRVIVLICLSLLLIAGCSTMGEVTGKTVKGVENAAGDFKQGYRKGKAQ